jgi:DNA-binding CsgD family transcriptional regulator/DNA-binding MarR family transcriptional regulator
MTVTITVPYGAAIPSLARWGLTSDADLVFRTISTFGPRSARALAGELGLTRHRVDSALAELHECGALTLVTAERCVDRRSLLWTSRPAADVVHRLRSRRLRSVDPLAVGRRHRATVQMLNARLAGAGLPVHPVLSGDARDGIRYLPDRPLVRQRLAAFMAQERHDHLVINNEEEVNPDYSRASPTPMRNPEVAYRIIGRPPLDDDATDPHGDEERRIAGSAYQYRETLDTPLKLFVCDRRVALIPADPLDVDRGYFEIAQPDIVAALVTLFRSRWESAVDPRADGVPTITLSERERDLVDLLALGHTDVTAARKLRISARSVTNAMRTLMDRLGVDNRFQLGLALGALRVTVPPSLAGGGGLRDTETTVA